MKPTCETCEFVQETKFGKGECRKLPPQFYKSDAGWAMFGWPEVKLTDWCGEHKPKGEEK